MPQVIIAVIVTLVVAIPITYFVATSYFKKASEAKIGNAEDKAREIIDEAVKTAETKKRESLLEVKEESIRAKNDLDKEIKERRSERCSGAAGGCSQPGSFETSGLFQSSSHFAAANNLSGYESEKYQGKSSDKTA